MVATRELEDHLLVLVNEALDSFLYDNAVFLAEILASVSPVNEAYQYLLAVCYHRSNQVREMDRGTQRRSYERPASNRPSQLSSHFYSDE